MMKFSERKTPVLGKENWIFKHNFYRGKDCYITLLGEKDFKVQRDWSLRHGYVSKTSILWYNKLNISHSKLWKKFRTVSQWAKKCLFNSRKNGKNKIVLSHGESPSKTAILWGIGIKWCGSVSWTFICQMHFSRLRKLEDRGRVDLKIKFVLDSRVRDGILSISKFFSLFGIIFVPRILFIKS